MKNLKPKKVNQLFGIILFVSAVIAFYGAFSENTIFSGIGMVGMMGAILFKVIFYRCPYCGKYLDRSTGKYCPYCGKMIPE